MKNFLITCFALFLLFPGGCNANSGQNKESRPNIIFILADDLGAGDLGCTGHPYAKTPNLDGLAEKGIRFDRAYMAAAWCAPSRYALMSGQYPARDFDQTRNLKSDEPSITKLLKNAGYKTAHIGKWHLNPRDNKEITPQDFGIDEHFTTSPVNTEHTWTREQRNKEYWRANMTDAYVDMAIDFMQRNNSTASPQPFYMNLWIYPTHSYIHPSPEQLSIYEGLEVDYRAFSPYQQDFLKFVSNHGDINKSMQAYCADVTAMDKALGRLFRFLEESGIDQNTLIVFTSDNGPGPLTPQVISESVVKRYKERPDLLNSVGSARVYKERKISLHDGGIRVPYIVAWPEKAPAGRVNQTSVIHGIDWLPTIASICNVELPNGTFDGINVESAFTGEEVHRTEPVFWTQAGNLAVLKDKWKGVLKKNEEFQLFDIVQDPAESKDLRQDKPDVAKEMEVMLKQWYNGINKNK